jgi:hypothetical protein
MGRKAMKITSIYGSLILEDYRVIDVKNENIRKEWEIVEFIDACREGHQLYYLLSRLYGEIPLKNFLTEAKKRLTLMKNGV